MISGIVTTGEQTASPEAAPQFSGKPAAPRDGTIERLLNEHLALVSFAVIAAGLVIRLSAAATGYLNPDEALHYLILNQPSLVLAYKASLTNAHPPLIYVLLYYWRILGRSEWMLRLPSVLAGTALCWVVYMWVGQMFGRAAALLGLILATFSPAWIALSAEIRSYSLLLLFEVAALYFAEAAFREKSVRKIIYSAVFLILAILSHYSAFFFALPAGVYGLARISDSRPPRKVIATWVLGQFAALAVSGILYVTHISKLRNLIPGWAMPYDGYYFHFGRESLFTFTRIATIQVFSYFFENPYTSVSLLLLFLAAVALQFFRDWRGRRDPDLVRGRGLLFVIPFVAVWGASLAGVYPYVGGRHTVFLAPLVIAALSGLLASVYGHKLWAALVIGLLLTAATALSGKTYEWGMTRADQSRDLMLGAMKYLRQSIPDDDLILTDYQSSLALAYYFCDPKQVFVTEKTADDYFEFGCNGRSFVAFEKWNVPAREFPSRFRATAQSRGFKPGERIWYFEQGWGPRLDRTLPWMAPGFRCLTSARFGAKISVIPLTVDSDFSPATIVSDCPPPAFNSFDE